MKHDCPYCRCQLTPKDSMLTGQRDDGSFSGPSQATVDAWYRLAADAQQAMPPPSWLRDRIAPNPPPKRVGWFKAAWLAFRDVMGS